MKITKFIIGFLVAQSLILSALSASDEIQVVIKGLRSTKGRLFVAVFDKAQGFPSQDSKAVARQIVEINPDKIVNLSFPVQKTGQYAVVAYHDENGNDKLDVQATGFPKEGFGTSNNAKALFGPPKFEDAKFTFPGKKQVTFNIKY